MTRDEISRLIEASGLMRRLARFDPHWVGSTYLGLHDDFSDIDICCSFAPSLEATRTDVEAACGVFGDYDLTDEVYGGQPSRIVRFRMGGMPVEVWGRARTGPEGRRCPPPAGRRGYGNGFCPGARL